MQIPLQITFRDLAHSNAAEALVRKRAAKLDHFAARMTSCRVALETAHRHHHEGKDYRVRILLGVPGTELVVDRDPPASAVHQDLYSAIDHAFDVAERLIEDHMRKRRGYVKSHETAPTARVARLMIDRGFGFLETDDGREIWFHKNSVVNGDFDQLTPGCTVRFVEEQGEKGPQASTVTIA